MRIVLQADTKLLDEVMVVAYGTARKSTFTGSAATVDTEQISNRSIANVSKALDGTVPGVQTTFRQWPSRGQVRYCYPWFWIY